jgi:hypothetical protein
MSGIPSHELLKALKTKWTASSLSAINGPYRKEAPYNTAFPYAIVDIDSTLLGTSAGPSDGSERWDHTVIFEVRDDKETDVNTYLALIRAVFKTTALTLSFGSSGHSLISCRLIDESNKQNDKKVWVGKLTYRFETNCPR